MHTIIYKKKYMTIYYIAYTVVNSSENFNYFMKIFYYAKSDNRLDKNMLLVKDSEIIEDENK